MAGHGLGRWAAGRGPRPAAAAAGGGGGLGAAEPAAVAVLRAAVGPQPDRPEAASVAAALEQLAAAPAGGAVPAAEAVTGRFELVYR